jgi:hypothetical protein
MRRLLALLFACGASISLYFCIFGVLVARPLVIDEIGQLMNYKLAYARQAHDPKIFVIAGSNARYSHSCAVIEAHLRRPCINAGIAFGIGLDWVLDNFRPYIRPGDVVYLPLEYEEYSVGRASMLTGADAAYRFRRDKLSLLARGPDGLIRAAFSFDLPVLIHSLGEMALQAAGVRRRVGVYTLDKQGDEVGHTDEQAKPYEPFIQALPGVQPNSRTLLDNPEGQQSALAAFLEWCKANGVVAVGGLPTVFDDRRIADSSVNLLRDFYARHKAGFVELPNRSQYPRGEFFDTHYHLRQRAQVAHSEMVAEALVPFLRPP